MSTFDLDKPGFDGTEEGGITLARFLCSAMFAGENVGAKAFRHCIERLQIVKRDPEIPGALSYVSGFFGALSDWQPELLLLFVPDESAEAVPEPEMRV